MTIVTMTRVQRLLVTLAFWCLASVGVAQAPVAPAPHGVAATQGEVFVVLAKAEPGAIDPALQSVTALREPPFSSYQSMQVLTRDNVSLQPNQPVMVSLPNGRKLQLVLLERLPDGRFKVRVSINLPGKRDYLPLLEVMASAGEPFFVAGQKHEGGTLVIGVTVGKRAPAAH
jgi:hypothetical protein